MWFYIKCYIQNKLNDQRGQGMVEYAVIVSVVIAVGLLLLGSGAGDGTFATAIQGVYTDLAASVKALIPSKTTPAS